MDTGYENGEALVAAINPFAGGNSRLNRSLRARAQPRDRQGQWIRTGIGFTFDFSIDGEIFKTIGRSAGVSPRQGFIQVYIPRGDERVPSGFYEIPASQGSVVKAVLDGPATIPSETSVTDKNIVDINSTTRLDAPEGWESSVGDDGAPRWVSQDGRLEIYVNPETGKAELIQDGEKVSEHDDVANAFAEADRRDVEGSLTKKSTKVLARLRKRVDTLKGQEDPSVAEVAEAEDAVDSALLDDPDSTDKLELVDTGAPDPESMGRDVEISDEDLRRMRSSPISSPHLDEDGNFTPERQALHDAIITEALSGSSPVENPTQWMNGGGPGSGKSSLTEGVNKELTGYDANSVLLDPDNVKKELPEVQEALARIEAGEASEVDIEWAGLSHEESSYIAKRIHLASLERHHNVIFDGTGDGGVDSVRKKVELARKNGYKRVEANYLYLEPDEGIKRAKARQVESFRKVPVKIIEETYENISQIFPQLVDAQIFDTLRLFDNNQERGVTAKLVFEQEDGEDQVLDQESYDRFLVAEPTKEVAPVAESAPRGAPVLPPLPTVRAPGAPEIVPITPERSSFEVPADATKAEVDAELANLRKQYGVLKALSDKTDDFDEFEVILGQISDVSSQINVLESRPRPTPPARRLDKDSEDTVESITTQINSVDAQMGRRIRQGLDTKDLEQRRERLANTLEALERGETPDGEIGQDVEPGGEGAVPSSVEGTTPGGPRVERQGDSLRDVSGNVVATRVAEPSNADEIRNGGSQVVELFEVEPGNSAFFRTALKDAADASEHGSSVTVHDLEYYQQDGVRMFLTQDGLGGVVLNGDEVVSGFMHPEASDRGQGAIISMVSTMVDLGARRLDAYDTVLPGFYAEVGFRPVARVKWDDEFAPEGWDSELYGRWNGGKPDIVFMVFDPERIGSSYDKSEGDYVDSYDGGSEAQAVAVARLDEGVISEARAQRNSQALADREQTLRELEEIRMGNGLLIGDAPVDENGAPKNIALVLAPIGQVVEVTGPDGEDRRYIKVDSDSWKRSDAPGDHKRYRSHQIRTGPVRFAPTLPSDVPSTDLSSNTDPNWIPTPFSFPQDASDAELRNLRAMYRNQALGSKFLGSIARANETVRIVDQMLAVRAGELPARDVDLVAPARDSIRVQVPLIEENSPESGTSTEAYTPGQINVPGGSDDPEVIASTFMKSDLYEAYLVALLTDSNTVRTTFPPADGESLGAEVTLPIDAVRDALQRMGVDTNEVSEPGRTSQLREEVAQSEVEGAQELGQFVAMSQREYYSEREELRNMYDSYEQLRSALAYAISTSPDSDNVENIRERMRALRGKIRRREADGLRITGNRPETVNLGDFKWDADTPDVYRPELVIDALREKYSSAVENSDGELVIGQSIRTVGVDRFKYEAVITRTDDELFYVYIRETNLSEPDPEKSSRSIRFGEMRHSARAVNNQAAKALAKIDDSATGGNIHSWFNDRRRRREGREPKFDVPDAQGVPHHIQDRVLTREAIRNIQEAVDVDDITEEMIGSLYNYLSNFGNDTAVVGALYETFGLDVPTLNRFVDAVNSNIQARDGLNRFNLWESDNGTPLAEGDSVSYIGGPNQRGFERLGGRRGIVKIRSLEHQSNGYTYTDYVYIQLVDDNGVPIRDEDFTIVSSHNLRLDSTSGNTDGSERRGTGAISMPLPTLTTRAGNRYAGRGTLGNVAPYVTEYDRDTLSSPTVDIFGEIFPVQASRQTLLGSDLASHALFPNEVRVGDFIRQFYSEDRAVRLVEVVNVENIDSGEIKLTLVEPINLTSAKVSQVVSGPSERILDVFRFNPDSITKTDPNIITSSHLGRLAEASRGADLELMQSEAGESYASMIEMFRYNGAPESSPFTMDDYNNVMQNLLSRQTNEPRGPVSVQEAQDALDRAVGTAFPDQDARSGLSAVGTAASERARQLGSTPSVSSPDFSRPLPIQRDPYSPPAPVSFDRGPYGAEAGVIEGFGREELVSLMTMSEDEWFDGGGQQDARAMIQDSLGNKIFGSKFTMRIMSVSREASGFSWAATIYDPDTDRRVGSLRRTYSTMAGGDINVHHDAIFIDDRQDRGTGFATEFKAVSDNFYRSVGVDRVDIYAVQDGAYAWALANYTWDPADRSGTRAIRQRLTSVASDFRDLGDTATAEKLEEMALRFEQNNFYDPDFPDPIDIATMTDSSGNSIGRRILAGNAWHGIRYLNSTLDLRPENRKAKRGPKEQGTSFDDADAPLNKKYMSLDADSTVMTSNFAYEAENGDSFTFTENGRNKTFVRYKGAWISSSYGQAGPFSMNPGSNFPDDQVARVINSILNSGSSVAKIKAKVSDSDREFATKFVEGEASIENPTNEATVKALRDGDKDYLDTLFLGTLLGGGRRVFGSELVAIPETSDFSDGYYAFSSRVENKDGVNVGRLVRNVYIDPATGKITMDHKLMKLEPGAKGTGFGSAYTKEGDDFYREIGVSDVAVHTAWDGSYFWATQGFEWDLEYSGSKRIVTGSLMSRLKSAAEAANDDSRFQDEDALMGILRRMDNLELDDPNFPTPAEIAGLQSEDPDLNTKARLWMRAIMTDSGWLGRKIL